MHLPPPMRAIVPRGEPLPPSVPGVRHVWLHRWGTLVADDDLRRRVDKFFYWPMIALGITVLPLIVLDCFFIYEKKVDGELVARSDWLWTLVITGLTIIWIAFAVEFTVKIAIAESRLECLRRNWLDVVIILIPLLRPLRVAYVARTTSVLRLRGVGFKVARFVFTLVVGMEATDRYLQKFGVKKRLDGRLVPEKMTRHELMTEVRKLRRVNDAWKRWHSCEQDFLQQQNRPRFDAPPPADSEVRPDDVVSANGESTPYNPADANRLGAAQPDRR